MFLWKIFDWFAANPAAQWAAGIGAGLVTFWGWISLRDRRRDKETKRKVLDKIEEKTDEAVQRVEDERERVSDLNDAERLRLAARSPNNRGRLQDTPPD